MSRPHSRLALAIPALAVLFTQAPVEANVRNVLPGSVCDFENEALRSGHYPGTEIAARNTTTGLWLRTEPEVPTTGYPITCPVERLLPLSTAGMSDLEIRFRAESDYTGTRAVTCVAVASRADGSTIHAEHMLLNVPGTGAVVTMDFNNALDASSSKGHTVIGCFLPPRVALMSIYASEVDGIDGN